MLKRFEVQNFKGFKDKLVFDLKARDYNFNKSIVNNNIVNKAIIYGKNGIGKSSLGIALFDIIMHLTDKERMPLLYLQNYINLDNDCSSASFKYVFVFDNDEIEYSYEKLNPESLLKEKLVINGKCVIDYDYFNKSNNLLDKDFVGDLYIDLVDNRLSILKYIYRNKVIDSNSPFYKMMKFVDGMLWYRSLSDGNAYCGYTNGTSSLVDRLYQSGRVHEFESFLKSNGVDYSLGFINVNGIPELHAYFDNGKKHTNFLSIASTGTMALFLFFTWSISAFKDISFLFIDEFDAFFHYESAENIVLRLNSAKNFQSVLTTHNTYLMQNKLTRPDCCFIMTKDKIANLYDCTDREIREAHNLEKMYINGAFNE